MRIKTVSLIASLCLLSACMVQSKVQGRYVEDQGNCRDSAEGNIGAYEKPGITTKDRNAQLVTLFANCMAKHGWQVAKPKRTTTTGPHGPLDPYGSQAKTTSTTTTTTTTGPVQQPGAAVQQQPQYYRQPATQAPVGQRPVQTQTTPLSPSGGMPPLSQPSAPYYQPARPYTSPVAEPYGSGAGRNF